MMFRIISSFRCRLISVVVNWTALRRGGLIALLLLALVPVPPLAGANGTITILIDADANRRVISPYIYGLNEATPELLRELGARVNRWGGNRSTPYNWREDTTSTSNDYYFYNLRVRRDRPAEDFKFKYHELFVNESQSTGSDMIWTVPMIGWVAKDDHSRSFSVSKYGAQRGTAPEHPDAGDGVRPDGGFVQNDPQDASVRSDLNFQRELLEQFVARYGRAADGGIKFYSLDNEPELWHETHRDKHPAPAGYDEIATLTKQYAAMIKDVDPTAQVTGPVTFGYGGYLYSARDGFDDGPDRKAHGNLPFLEWYLQEMRRAEQASGRRLLDILDVHYYPETRAGKDYIRTVLESHEEGDAAVQAARLRSTRSLWDPAYKDESWIDQPVRLIPWLHEMIARSYPGTKLALSEYAWGPPTALTSALAQADALGIFGREELFMATFWNAAHDDFPGSAAAFAFKMYGNYDGRGARFGEIGVAAYSSDQSALSVYAALSRRPGRLTVIIINKSLETLYPQLEVRNFRARQFAGFRYPGNDLNSIAVLPYDRARSLQQISAQGFPPRSITLLEVSSQRGRGR